MDSHDWDERYAATDLVWSATPNVFVEAIAADLQLGRVLDLAAGEGRNALWLAERGWDATAVDFSSVAVERTKRLAAERLSDATGSLDAVVGDARTWRAEVGFDLVLVIYLHLPAADRRAALRNAASAVAPGGMLVVLGHHRDNLTEGVGGPQDASVLFSETDVVADLQDSGLTIDRAERALRTVSPDGPQAIDALAVATRR